MTIVQTDSPGAWLWLWFARGERSERAYYARGVRLLRETSGMSLLLLIVLIVVIVLLVTRL